MHLLDIKTIIFLLAAIQLVQLGVLAIQFRVNKEYKGPGWWLAWGLAESVGFACLLFREKEIAPLIFIQNFSLFLGHVFNYIGVRKFFGRSFNSRVLWSSVILFALLHIVFLTAFDSAEGRAALVHFSVTVFSFLTALSLFLDRPVSIRFSSSFTGAVILFHCLFSALSGSLKLLGISTGDPVVPNLLNYMTYLDALMVSLLVTFGFIIMLNHRLNATLSETLSDLRMAEAREREQILELEKSNIEKDRFYSVLAHDLRAPFNVLLGFSRFLNDELSTMKFSDIIKVSASIHRSSEGLHGLLENLLEWSRAQRGITRFEPVIIDVRAETMESLKPLRSLAESKSIALEVEVPEDLPAVADKHMFETLIRNLVLNSVKFTKPGGRIRIDSSLNDSGSLTVNVTDSGIGMDPAILSKIFDLDPDSTRKGTSGEPSSGLGLLICKEFITRHGGRIWAESEPGKGSSFHFNIPVQASL
jgi:signal transduction histidine kinase